MAEELDEFGIPIKKKQAVSNQQLDDFGIPIKKKTSLSQSTSTSATSGTNARGFDVNNPFGGQTQEEFIGEENAKRIKSESAKPLKIDFSKAPKNLTNTDQRSTIEKDLSAKRAAKLEEKGTDVMNSLGAGVNQAYAGIAKIPRYIFEAFGVPQDLLANAVENAAGEDLLSGIRTTGKEYDTLLGWLGGNNPLANSPLTALDKLGDTFQGRAEEFEAKQTKYNQGIFDSITSGNLSDAGAQIVNNIAQSVPSMLTMATTSGIGNAGRLGTLSRTALNTLPFASSKANEIRDDENIPNAIKPIYSGLYGLAEVIYDQSFGTQAMLDKVLSTATKSGGREVAEREAKDFVKGYLTKAFSKIKEPITDIGKNAIEEGATKLSQNILDKLIVDPDKDLSEGLVDSIIVGGAMGTVFSGVNMVIKPSVKANIQAKNQEIEVLSQDLDNPNIDEGTKEVLLDRIGDIKQEINTELTKEQEAFGKLPEEAKEKALEVSSKINSIEQSLASEGISEQARNVLTEQLGALEKELDEVTKVNPTSEIEANIETLTTPTEQTTTETIHAVTEPNLASNEEISVQENSEVPAVEETAQNEVLAKAETDLEALKQVADKTKKYDASIKRLIDAKNNGTITEKEFNEQKKRFDDVLRESAPKTSNLGNDEAQELNDALIEDGITIEDIIEYETEQQEARINQEAVQQSEPNGTTINGQVDTNQTTETKQEIGGKDANVKPSAKKVDVVEQTTDGGRVGEGNTQQETALQTAPEQIQGGEQEETSGITQASTAKARETMGVEAYEKTSQTNEVRRQKAEQAIKDGYNVKQLVANIKSNEDFVPSRQEFEILKIYENSLAAAIKKNPTTENIAERAELLRTVDVATSRAGASLQAIAGQEALEDNLANFLQQEAVYYGVDQLPQSIINELKAKYEAGQEAKEAYERGYQKAKEEFIKQQAELELDRQRSKIKPSIKKTKADYTSERDELRKSIKDKLRKARGQLNAAPLPYVNELIAIAPDVAKLVKSYVEEGVSNLNDIVKRVHKDLEEEIEGITESDVIDLISGQYNAKRPTKTEILSQVRGLREQAKLLKKIEDLENGKVPTDSIKKIRRNAELERLRAQVKDLEDETGITEARSLKSRRTALDNKIKQLQEDLELGNFDLEQAEPRKIRLDPETQKKQDEYIAFLKETNRRRDQAMYEQQSGVTKAWLKFQQVLGLRRLIQTSIDFSMPFRQAVTVTLNPRYVPTTLKAFGNMFKSTFSEKKYDRIMFDIQQDPLYQDMRIDGLMFSEVDSKDNLKREEDFRTSFLYQIPYLREPFLASNRAAAGYINTARYNLYLKGVERLRAQGITHENSPQNYEALAKWVMNMTGRGNLLSFMEKGENATKWQRIMGDTFYGTRLMASRFNMLNPNYYARMPKEQRIEALKDLGSYAALSAVVAFGAIAAGATVSYDPEDADFLKAKWGNKRYDLFTGGMTTYLRTVWRLLKAIYQRTNPKLYGENKDERALKKANKYGSFAVKSGVDFFRYKLAPNTSYVLSGTLGKDALGNPFDPSEIYEFYPMYVDDLREASKKDNAFMESMSILAPSLFGIGVQEYGKPSKQTKEKE